MAKRVCVKIEQHVYGEFIFVFFHFENDRREMLYFGETISKAIIPSNTMNGIYILDKAFEKGDGRTKKLTTSTLNSICNTLSLFSHRT